MFQLKENGAGASVSASLDSPRSVPLKPRRSESLFGASTATIQQARMNEKSLLEATARDTCAESNKSVDIDTTSLLVKDETVVSKSSSHSYRRKPPQSPKASTSSSRSAHSKGSSESPRSILANKAAASSLSSSRNTLRKSVSDASAASSAPSFKKRNLQIDTTSSLTSSRPPLPRSSTRSDKSPKMLVDDIVSMYETGLMAAPSFNSTTSTKSVTPNDVVWRAYATTKSFGKVISVIVIAQAVARGWLARCELKRLIIQKQEREEKEFRERAAIVIQRYVRRWMCRKSYKDVVKGMLEVEL